MCEKRSRVLRRSGPYNQRMMTHAGFRPLRSERTAVFALLAGSIYAAGLWLASRLAAADSPSLLAAALAFDLTVTVTVLAWLLLVRTRVWPVWSLAVVFVTAVSAAAFVIPAQYQGPLHLLGWVALPVELALCYFIFQRIRRARREFQLSAQTAGQHPDMLELLQRATTGLLGESLAARLIASEFAALYYALGSGRRQPATDDRAFSYHDRCGYGGLLLGLLLLLGFELFAMHFLVAYLWSHTAAWILTGLSAYTMLWLRGDFHAMQLRPILLRSDGLLLRCGLRCTLLVSYGAIALFRRVNADTPAPRGCLQLVPADEPDFELHFCEPQAAEALFGLRRRVACVRLCVDDRAEFERQLLARLSGASCV